MIKKLLIATVLFLAVYAGFLRIFKKDSFISQNARQDNLIRAENYIYTQANSASTVIVGSSLSCRINLDSLPSVHNLALNGMSVFDGLKILNASSKKPALVLVEMNIIFRPPDDTFYATLYNPFFYRAKQVFPAFREGKQPLGLAGVVLGFTIQKAFQNEDQSPHQIIDKGLYQDALARAEKENKDTSRFTAVSRQLKLLKNLVQPLEQAGTRIIFFEVPQNARFHDYPLPTTIRRMFFRQFPPVRYPYIMLPDWKGYQTSDGVHLGLQEANVYSGFLGRAIRQVQ